MKIKFTLLLLVLFLNHGSILLQAQTNTLLGNGAGSLLTSGIYFYQLWIDGKLMDVKKWRL